MPALLSPRGFVATLAVVLAPWNRGLGQVDSAVRPEIVTTASAEVTLPPARVEIWIGIEGRGATAAAASGEHGPKLDRVLAALAGAGFGARSYESLGFAITPNYDFAAGRKLLDYSARTTLQLTLRDLDRVAQVLDTALAAGATDVPVLRFESDTTAAGRRAALSQAVNEARADAEALAQAAGGRLGRLLSLTTNPRPDLLVGEMISARAASYAGGPVIQREIRIRVVVQGRWEFTPRR